MTPAEEAQARLLVANGRGALQRSDYANAIGSLREVQRLTGRLSPQARELREAISQRGQNEVGGFLTRGRCPDAQRLYTQLASVGAERGAASQFRDPRYCPVPR